MNAGTGHRHATDQDPSLCRRQLLQMATMEKNRRQIMLADLAGEIDRLISELQRQVEHIGRHLDVTVQVQPQWQQYVERLIAVPGLGPTMLYMESLSAVRFNPPIRIFYQRLLARGKHKKIAFTACMHKLLIMLNAMVRDNAQWCFQEN